MQCVHESTLRTNALRIFVLTFAYIYAIQVCYAVKCPYICSLKNGCMDDIRAEIKVCSPSYKQKLISHMQTLCTLVSIPDERTLLNAMIGDSIEVIAHSIDDIPDSTVADGCSKVKTRSGSPEQDSGSSITRLGRVKDLDLTLQQERDAYTMDSTFYTKFHVYESMVQRWEEIAQRSPKASLERIGATFERRDIMAIRIGSTSVENPKRIVINALLHAREWASTMVATYIAESLVDAIESRPSMYNVTGSGKTGADRMQKVADLLKSVEVIVVPMSNPDGYIYTTDVRFHRKNMRNNRGSICIGVDLNRNWGVDYGGRSSTSRSKCNDVYIGTGVFSEPESLALRNLFANTPGIVAHLDYHSYGGMILGPWSWSRTEAPPGSKDWLAFAAAMNTGMGEVRGNKYRSGLGIDGVLPYAASGVMADWTYDQTIQSATVEVAPVVDQGETLGMSGFILDTAELPGACADNFGALIGALQWAHSTATHTNEYETYYAPCVEI